MGNFFRQQRNLLNSDNSVQIKNREYHSLTALFRECSISRQCFQSDNRRNERGDKKQTPECGGLAEKDNTDEHRPDGANARPDGVSGAQWQRFCGLRQKRHTQSRKGEKAYNPRPVLPAADIFGLPQTEGEAHLAQPRGNQNYPIHTPFATLFDCKSIKNPSQPTVFQQNPSPFVGSFWRRGPECSILA